MARNVETDIHEMDGLLFEMTEEIASKLRDDAVAAAIDAEVKKDKWAWAVVSVASVKLRKKFGHAWRGMEGVIQFSNGYETVKLIRVIPPGWRQIEPEVVYYRKLKSGKYSKSECELAVSYVLAFFRST